MIERIAAEDLICALAGEDDLVAFLADELGESEFAYVVEIVVVVFAVVRRIFEADIQAKGQQALPTKPVTGCHTTSAYEETYRFANSASSILFL